MTYQEFNSKILDFYLSRSTSSYCHLSIDSSEMESIIPLNNLKEFDLLKDDWSKFIYTKRTPPQYFGLISIQCYAASLMQSEGNYSASAYQIRLRELLNLEEDSELQNLFKGPDKNNPVQEEIWWRAESFMKSEYNLQLALPPKTTYAGRFVQYPKSQALLNTEDLKHFTLFFSEEFQIKETITFDFFRKKLAETLSNIKISSRVKLLFEDDAKIDACLKQVFTYYNSWDGEVYFTVGRNRQSRSPLKQIKNSIVLSYQQQEIQFYLTSENEIKEINGSEVLKLLNHKYFYNDIIIFNALEYYDDEYEESRFLYDGNISFIAMDIKVRTKEFQFLEKNCKQKIEIDDSIKVYKVAVDHTFIKSPLRKFISTAHPVKLRGGLKINRKNEFLIGFGPKLISTNDYSVFHNNHKLEYDPTYATSGHYKIRVANYPDITFLVCDSPDDTPNVLSKSSGWNFNRYHIDQNFQLEGCLLSKSSDVERKIGRRWIDINNGRTKQYRDRNILLRALKNANQ